MASMRDGPVESSKGRQGGTVIAYNGSSAGLGNRMRVTLGAAAYATWRGARFYYVWPTTSQFRPRLSDLWQEEPGNRMPRAVSQALSKVTGYAGSDLSGAEGRKVVQVRTGGELVLPAGAPDWKHSLRVLTPVPRVEEAVRPLHAQFEGDPYVGVQIRASTQIHQRTRDSSPVSWFIAQMREIAAERHEARFYVSCDVPKVKQEILAEFPTAVGLSSDAHYNSTEAVQTAVADLYLLASSSFLIGPHASSFIELAEALAGGVLRAVKPTESIPSPECWWETPPARDPLQPALRR